MSRVDRALRISEGLTTVAEPSIEAAEPIHGGFNVTDYPTERVAPAHSRDTSVPETAPATFAPQPPSAPAPVDSAELNARLVTGGVDAVTIEQYRRLAAALHDAQVERGLKTLMVTSALPGEGKTLTITNLALTLSESYARRVLVIDADLRRPSVHSMFGLTNVHGLSEALRHAGREPVMTEVSSRLTVMTAGQPSQTPLAGLTSARMGALLSECASRFEWVLVDTSPVGVLPDGQVLARLIGAVLFVINAGQSPAAAVQRAVADIGLEYVVGTVLNRVEDRRIPEAGYYASYGTPGASAARQEVL